MITTQLERRKFRRKLSIERIYLTRPMNYVVMNAVIKGYIAKKDLNLALNSLIRKHQFLRARIELDKEGCAWFVNQEEKLVNEDSLQFKFEIRCYNDLSLNDVEVLMAKEHTRFFDILEGPLIRFSLVHNIIEDQPHTMLLITSHHSICDGLSLSYLIKDILMIISKTTQYVRYEPPPPMIDKKYIPERKTPLLTRILLKIINRIWKKRNISFSQQNYYELYRKFWKTYDEPYIILEKFSERVTLQLMKKCRNHQVSVHSALMTAFLMAQTHFQGDKEPYLRDFHMPIDIRDRLHIPAGERMGFYAVSMILKHNIGLRKSFWENTKAIHKQIQKWLASNAIYRLNTITFFDPLMLDSLYFEKLGLIQNKISRFILKKMGISKKIAGVAVTNLGKLNIPTIYGEYELKEIYGPSVYTEILEKVIGVTTINNQLCLTVTSGKDLIDRMEVEKQVSFVKHLLENAT